MEKISHSHIRENKAICYFLIHILIQGCFNGHKLVLLSLTMKRRNAECGKLRRPVKRNKITEGLYGSTFLYLKFLLVWSLVLIADFILEFRFEYLWPFWLLVRSVYDSFKYQGLAFSVFFVCIAVTSDVVCFLYVPVQWLFFAASTYVWVQYVWHTERGICLPTVSLWLLFVYIEASVRLRELKSLPFNLDLCRPFAAHCIGYPVVTLGFGFKSYVTYRVRLRKQKEVQKENEFYVKLLNQALPPEIQNVYTEKNKALVSKTDEEVISNGTAGKRTYKSAEDKKQDDDDDELDYIEQPLPSSKKSTNDNISDEATDNIVNDQKSLKVGNGTVSKPSNKINPNTNTTKKGKNYTKDISSVVALSNYKDDSLVRLETDMKKVRNDLQVSRNTEQDLRSQINTQALTEKQLRSELYQLQQDNENLQNKLHNLVTNRQTDKQNLAASERKLAEERKRWVAIEQQLSQERKAKKAEEAAAARAVAMAAANKGECTSDTCKTKRRDMEMEQKQLRRDLKLKEEQLRQLERELKNAASQKDLSSETEVLMSALSAMQDKNTHLECSLSSETRIKLDLFSALGDAKRHLEIQQGVVTKKDTEIASLKKKIAEVMALVPSSTYNGITSHTPPPSASPLFTPASSPYPTVPSSSPLYSPSPDLLAASNLNPNACDYLPKTTA